MHQGQCNNHAIFKKMATNQLAVCSFIACIVVSYMLLVAAAAGPRGGDSACGKTPIRSAALSLSPCLGATQNPRAKVPPACCSKVNALIRTAPKCLCAVLLSPIASQAGIKPVIGVAIPKRCNIRNRPVGKKCGRYTVP